jgi:hypothetical protein
MQSTTKLALLTSALLLSGCGNELSGTYEDEDGITRYTFSGNGEVRISVLGNDVDAEYRLDNDKVLVSSAQGTVVLTRRDDRLYGPMGLELLRQQLAKGE